MNQVLNVKDNYLSRVVYAVSVVMFLRIIHNDIHYQHLNHIDIICAAMPWQSTSDHHHNNYQVITVMATYYCLPLH